MALGIWDTDGKWNANVYVNSKQHRIAKGEKITTWWRKNSYLIMRFTFIIMARGEERDFSVFCKCKTWWNN